MAWRSTWPKERHDAELRVYRAQCKLRCLEANLDRIDYEEFDELMSAIEATRAELHAAIDDKIIRFAGTDLW